MRRLPAAVLVLALLGIAADRIADRLTERTLGKRLQTTEDLAARPDVDVTGFPFLTQALSGHYDRVDVRIRGLQRGELRVARVVARLSGVRVPARAVLAGRAGEVPVAVARAEALLAYNDLTRAVGRDGVTITAAGDRLLVREPVTVLGRRVTASALGTVSLRRDVIRVRVSDVEVGGRSVPAAATSGVAGRLTFAVSACSLPFGLRLTDVRVTPAGLVAVATGQRLVLRTA